MNISDIKSLALYERSATPDPWRVAYGPNFIGIYPEKNTEHEEECGGIICRLERGTRDICKANAILMFQLRNSAKELIKDAFECVYLREVAKAAREMRVCMTDEELRKARYKLSLALFVLDREMEKCK